MQAALESKTRPETVSWLAVDEATRTGRLLERPGRADIPLAVQEQLIVELDEVASCAGRTRAAAAWRGPWWYGGRLQDKELTNRPRAGR